MFPHFSVEHNLLYGFKLLPPAQRQFTPAQIIDLLDIGHLLHRQPRHLFGGAWQQVALGRTLLVSPRLLLLDEPLVVLDEGRKQQILLFLRLRKALRTLCRNMLKVYYKCCILCDFVKGSYIIEFR